MLEIVPFMTEYIAGKFQQSASSLLEGDYTPSPLSFLFEEPYKV